MELILQQILERKDLLRCDKAESIARAMIVWDNPYADDKTLSRYWLDKAYEYMDTPRVRAH